MIDLVSILDEANVMFHTGNLKDLILPPFPSFAAKLSGKTPELPDSAIL